MGPTLLNIKTETVHDKVQRKSQITPNWNKNSWHTNPVDHSFSPDETVVQSLLENLCQILQM